MADIIETIAPSGADRTSPATWHAALTADHPDDQIGVMTGADTYTAKLVANTSNAGGGEMILTGRYGAYTAGAPGGLFGAGATIQGAAAATGYAAEIYSLNFTCRDFCLKIQQQVNGYVVWTNSASIGFENMVIDGRAGCQQDGMQLTGGASGHRLEGCVIGIKCVTAATDYAVQLTDAYAHKILGNSMILPDGFNSRGGFYQHPNSTGLVYNNVVLAHTGATASVGCYSGAYLLATVASNVASDTTATGTSALNNQLAASWFTNVTAGSEDLHTLKGQVRGVNLTSIAALSIDIDGDNRPGSAWSLGADEVAAAPSSDSDSNTFFNGVFFNPVTG